MLKLYSRDDHAQDRRRRREAEPASTPTRCATRSTRSKRPSPRSAGAEHFQGVTVQPMVKLSDGYEMILGSSIDPQFGPVLLFGTGGQLVEVFKDRALGLPPLNTTLARRMMEQTKIYTALKGVRGRKPVDLAALERLLVRFSQLVVEQPWIKEIDINPLLASPDGLVALDARVVLHGPTSRRQAARARDPPLPDAVRHAVDAEGRHAGHDPADPPGGRAADGAVPPDALGAQRAACATSTAEARPARRARAADPRLLHRLRPRDGAGRRANATPRPASRRSSASAGSARSPARTRRSSPCSSATSGRTRAWGRTAAHAPAAGEGREAFPRRGRHPAG